MEYSQCKRWRNVKSADDWSTVDDLSQIMCTFDIIYTQWSSKLICEGIVMCNCRYWDMNWNLAGGKDTFYVYMRFSTPPPLDLLVFIAKYDIGLSWLTLRS